MKIADLREAAMEWTVTIEGPDEFGEIQRAQVQIEKGFEIRPPFLFRSVVEYVHDDERLHDVKTQ